MIPTDKINAVVADYEYRQTLLAQGRNAKIKKLLLPFYETEVKPVLTKHGLRLVCRITGNYSQYDANWWLEYFDKAWYETDFYNFIDENDADRLYNKLDIRVGGRYLVYYLPDTVIVNE